MTEARKELLRTIKFTLLSISAGVIQFLSFALLNELFHLPEWVSHLVSLIASVVWNFTLNRKYTFHSANNIPKAMALVALFYLVFTPLSTWWTAVLNGPQVGWNEYVVEILTMLANFVLEYFYQRFVVFRKSIDSAASGQ